MMSAPEGPGRRAWPLLIPMALLLSGCGVLTSVTTPGPAPTPVLAITTLVPTAPPQASPSFSASSTPTGAPTPETTSSPAASVPPSDTLDKAARNLCAEPSGATSYYCWTKTEEGMDGGQVVLDLPNAIAMDYWVSGTCVFSLGLDDETSAVGPPGLTITVTGPAVAGTWRVRIKPGQYLMGPDAAVGCVYSFNVRDDR